MTSQTSADRPRIVVGVDGSAPSRAALRWAVLMAPTLGAQVEAVTAWDYPTNYGWAVGYPTDWNPELDAQKVLEATVDETFAAERPADLVLSVRHGHPTPVLLAACEGATMLVVGSRGHGGFAGLMLGSVSRSCVEHATCPVLVIHGAH